MHPPRFSVQDAERIPEEQEMEAPVSQSCHPCSVRTSGTQDTLLGRWWTLKITSVRGVPCKYQDTNKNSEYEIKMAPLPSVCAGIATAESLSFVF